MESLESRNQATMILTLESQRKSKLPIKKRIKEPWVEYLLSKIKILINSISLINQSILNRCSNKWSHINLQWVTSNPKWATSNPQWAISSLWIIHSNHQWITHNSLWVTLKHWIQVLGNSSSKLNKWHTISLKYIDSSHVIV